MASMARPMSYVIITKAPKSLRETWSCDSVYQLKLISDGDNNLNYPKLVYSEGSIYLFILNLEYLFRLVRFER